MMSANIQNAMPARTSPGQTRSALPEGEPGQANEKWATGTNHRRKWERADNINLMICYYKSQPTVMGYMKRMKNLWETMNPDSNLTDKQLVTQKHNITKKKLLSTLEIEEAQRTAEEPENEQQDEDQVEVQTIQSLETSNEEMQPLNEEEEEIKEKILETWNRLRNIAVRQQLPKLRTTKPNEKALVEKVNKVLGHITTKDITETNCLMYATVTIILNELGVKIQSQKKPNIPPWRRRLEQNIRKARKEVNQLSKIKTGTSRTAEFNSKTVKEQLETSKQRLMALTSRLDRYTHEANFKRINTLFTTDPSKVYSKLKGQNENHQQPEPPKQQTEIFWKNIWEKEISHNKNAKWLKDLEDQHQNNQPQEEVHITEQDVQGKVRHMKNWKAPGPDMIHAYWLKKLKALHSRLAKQMNQLIQNGNHPKWLTQGRTTLLIKDPQQGAIPKNYRPITCLPTTWKLFSGIIAQKIQQHMNGYMHETQKGIGNKSRGTKHQLLIDKAVIKDSKNRQTNLSLAWIDYKKAYDSVPHSWILKCLKLYKVNPKLTTLIKTSMSHWKTTLMVNNKEISPVAIKCGIYQGDALSPLLFCICLNPLSDIIKKSEYGYKFKNGTKINHLFYMDDIKLYGKSEREIDSLINLTRIFSDDIGMSFGLDKCGRLVTKRGHVIRTGGIDLPDGHIDDIQESYKYLGVLQSYGNHNQEVRKKATREYKKRIRQVLKSDLTAKNKIIAINTYATPVIRYTAGIIDWPKEEITKLDIDTRKLFTMHGALHPKSNVSRLYWPRKDGGRGLYSIASTIHSEEKSLLDYTNEKEKTDKLIAECLRAKLIQEKDEPPQEDWKNKPLHGQFHRNILDVADLEQTYQWLEKCDIRDSTEALIMAAQEQAVKTRAIEAKIWHTRQDSKCRLCKQHDETIQHIITGCTKLAGTAYMERHNQVALIVYRNICKTYNIETPKNWWEYPEKVVENDQAKILWDFHIQTDKQVRANQPDIVIVDKDKKEATIIDIAIPNDVNIREKEHEKIDKYQPLSEELRRIWKVKTNVVPVVVGSLGAVTPTHQQWLDKIPGKHCRNTLQKCTLLGTSKIIRRTLKLPGLW